MMIQHNSGEPINIQEQMIIGIAEELGFSCKEYWYDEYSWYHTKSMHLIRYRVKMHDDILMIYILNNHDMLQQDWVEFDINDPNLIENISKAIK